MNISSSGDTTHFIYKLHIFFPQWFIIIRHWELHTDWFEYMCVLYPSYVWKNINSIKEMKLEHFREFPFNILTVRFHNIYGPPATCFGRGEFSHSAFYRKSIKLAGELKVWGDINQTYYLTFFLMCWRWTI